MDATFIRCRWPKADPLMVEYHDTEWGVPLHDDQKLFEFMVLDSFQAGLSWSTVLRKRENFRTAFDHFDVKKVATFSAKKVEKLMADSGIIRNRQKINAAIQNAKAFLEIQEEFGSFDAYIWKFVNGSPKTNHWKTESEIPASSSESDLMSRDLKKRGFQFVGSKICYAFMQAAGMVNDHVVTCFRYVELCKRKNL